MSYYTVVLFSTSIFIAAFIGILRFNKISRIYYPIIICIWVGSLNEIASMIVSRLGSGTSVNNNIYMLAEAALLIWQFKKWGIINGGNILFNLIIVSTGLLWYIEFKLIKKGGNLFYFSIIYCMAIVLMSVKLITRQIISYNGNLITNARFILCCGFIIYFTFRILVEAVWKFGLNSSKVFRYDVYLTITWINLFVNILNSFALLWIPKKPRFISI